MSMYAQFQTDPKLEKDGVIIDYGDFRVTVARAGGANKEFRKAAEFFSRPHRRAIDAGIEDVDRDAKILRQVFARAIVKNWEMRLKDETDDQGNPKWVQAIEQPDGSPAQFNPVVVERVLEELPDLFTDLQTTSTRASLYRKAGLEQDAGN